MWPGFKCNHEKMKIHWNNNHKYMFIDLCLWAHCTLWKYVAYCRILWNFWKKATTFFTYMYSLCLFSSSSPFSCQISKYFAECKLSVLQATKCSGYFTTQVKLMTSSLVTSAGVKYKEYLWFTVYFNVIIVHIASDWTSYTGNKVYALKLL